MKKPITIVTVVLAMSAAHASADVLYDNFGPGDSYSLDSGATLSYGGPLGGDVHEAAVAFTVTGGSYYLNAADFAVLHSWGPDLVFANIHSDLDGAPGAIIDSTSASGVTEPYEWAPPMTATFSGDVVLHEGQQYWLALKTDETDALLAWAKNVVDDFGLRAWQVNGTGWNTGYGDPGTDSQRSVFRIHGTLVPAPGALAVLAFAGMAGHRRRSRN